MTKRDMKRAGVVVAATVGLVVLAIAAAAWRLARYPDTAAAGPPRAAKIIVERGTSLGEIARRLGARHIIDHPSWFRFYANQRGLAQKVKTGEYAFSSTQTPRQILARLIEGVPVPEVAVTIPEGKNILQVAALVEAAGICSHEDLLRLARDSRFMQKLGIVGPSLEGYLFPDTYRFVPGTRAEKVLTVMVHHAKQVLAELEAAHPAGVAMLQKSYHFGERQIVIMASLVEKETAQPAERPRIAGLFLNRLRLKTFVPHVLQTDPTIVYGCTVPVHKSAACQRFDGRIRRVDLEDRDNPYNTYTHAGLPPGPIANPGRASLEAVIEPDQTPYLYFVSKNDGTHYFSRTRAEHEAAVDKYQRHLSK